MSVVDGLVRARADFERGDWRAALAHWSDGDPGRLTAEDLCSAAEAAQLLGQADLSMDLRRRAFERFLGEGQPAAAVHCCYHLSMQSALHGQAAQAAGWTARAEQLAEELSPDDPQQGFVSCLRMFAAYLTGQIDQALMHARRATEIGRRHGDANLISLALCSQGRMSIFAGRVKEGLAQLDEAMTYASTEHVGPVLLGHVYCTAIEGCQQIGDLGRMVEWTETLSRWCSAHPGLVAFTGQCSLHRGQVLRAHGAWSDAIEELDAAMDRYQRAGESFPVGQAAAERGDLQLVMGDLTAAEASFRLAAEHGCDPQPGLALLWLRRGALPEAVAAVRRLLVESDDPLRHRVLPAAVEIFLAAGDHEAATDAARQLEAQAGHLGCTEPMIDAALSSGAVQLAVDDPAGALPYARKARQLALASDLPYAAARAQVLTARALIALDDVQSARLELSAARETFAVLGARPDLRAVDDLLGRGERPGGLSEREVEVLRLVAGGRSNAQIAAELVLSDRTVARHLSNILGKLGVGSRTAAAAFAFEHGLV